MLKQEHEATARVGKVEEPRLAVVIFPPHVRVNVTEEGSDKASMSEPISPVVSVVFFSAKRKDFRNFLDRQSRYKFKPNLFSIILYTTTPQRDPTVSASLGPLSGVFALGRRSPFSYLAHSFRNASAFFFPTYQHT